MKRVILLGIFISIASALFSFSFQNDILPAAEKCIGSAYILGGDAPGGFDCSGLIFYLYKPYITNIPRTVEALNDFSVRVPDEELKPGDIIFFATGEDPEEATHVALYIGEEKAIHAISRGKDTGVNITPIGRGYWKEHYLYAGRFPGNSDIEEPAETEETETVQPSEDPIIQTDAEGKADPKTDTYSDWKDEDEQSFEEWLKEN